MCSLWSSEDFYLRSIKKISFFYLCHIYDLDMGLLIWYGLDSHGTENGSFMRKVLWNSCSSRMGTQWLGALFYGAVWGRKKENVTKASSDSRLIKFQNRMVVKFFYYRKVMVPFEFFLFQNSNTSLWKEWWNMSPERVRACLSMSQFKLGLE